MNPTTEFETRLRKGWAWEDWVAKFLELQGHEVELGVKAIRNGPADTETFTRLEQDVIVNGKVYEVKSRNIAFTSPYNYPFLTVLIDTVEGYKAKAVKPAAYIIVSVPTGTMLITEANPANWTQRVQYDRVRGTNYPAYFSPPGLFTSLDKWHF